MYVLYYIFFFFKQKTAYEMRISDWSSDVCSSDLLNDRIEGDAEITRLQEESLDPYVETRTLCLEKRQREIDALKGRSNDVAAIPATETVRETGTSVNSEARSEEHTSELQSLMRISYAVSCLKTKNT